MQTNEETQQISANMQQGTRTPPDTQSLKESPNPPIKSNTEASWTVERVVLHQGFTIPGGPTETSMYTHKGVEMKYTPHGLFCEYKGNKFIVPLANVIVAYEKATFKSDNVRR